MHEDCYWCNRDSEFVLLDLIVPVYNEGENIKQLFEEISSEIKTPKRVSVIYDFDEDNTLPVVNEVKQKYDFEIRTVKNEIGRGVLNAVKTGFAAAEHEKVLVLMADLSDRLNVVDEMSRLMDSGFDVVCGSRYMKGGKQHGGGFLKTVFSRGAGLSLHFLTGIPTHDVTNNFKMYRKTLLDSIEVESTGGFEIALEITVKAFCRGYKITEIPSEWFDRTAGTSNFHMWKWMPSYLRWYFYCIKNSWFGRNKK